MNILFYRYGSICEPDIIDAFKQLGNTVDEITIEIYNKNFTPSDGVSLLSDTLFLHTYDFVFSINFYPFISEVCNIFKIRYLCWTVDSPVAELYSPAIYNEWNRIFLFDSAQYNTFIHYNPNCIFHLPLASNPARWSSVIHSGSADDKAKFSNDISFVGSLYTEKCDYHKLGQLSDYLQGYLYSIMTAQSKVYGYHFLESLLSDSIVSELSTIAKNQCDFEGVTPENARSSYAQFLLDPIVSAIERISTMKLLGAHFPVNLYTASDTTGLSVKNCGTVKTLTEMPLVFHHSKINLNITAKAIRNGLPLRIFDILGCGGFLLTNYQPELTDYFTPGYDIVYYTDEEDLLKKTEYYLEHDKERTEIAQNGFDTITKKHTYSQRLLEMLTLAYGYTKG